jgi:hypothetical protein
MSQYFRSDISRTLPFDNATNGFTATEAQSAIEEARATAEGKARYCVSCGFDGNASTGRYLEYNSNVDSNQSGFVLPRNSILKEMSLCVNTSATITFGVYYWNGTTETLLTSISLSAARTATSTGLNISVSQGWEIRVKCTAGSASRPILFQFYQVA